MPFKKDELGLQKPVASAKEKFLSLQRVSTELIRVMTGENEFSTTDHLQAVKKEISKGKKSRDDVNNAKIEGIV